MGADWYGVTSRLRLGNAALVQAGAHYTFDSEQTTQAAGCRDVTRIPSIRAIAGSLCLAG